MVSSNAIPEAIPPRQYEGLDQWIFRDREGIEQRFGMELEKVLELYNSDMGRKQLLEQMQTADPSLNGNIHSAMELVDSNIEQLQKKESFLKKMVKLPVRAVQAVGRTMKKHPVLTAIGGTAALIALLYSIPMLAPGVGAYGTQLIDSFKTVLGKVGVPIPEAAVDAIGAVPVTGGAPLAPEVVEGAGEILQSPGAIDELTETLKNLSM